MKNLPFFVCVIATGIASSSLAGNPSYAGSEMKQVEQAPCPSWYADNEWNIGISGTYAANVNGNDNIASVFTNDDPWEEGFGGAIDLKYFFRRFWGVGLQGFGLRVEDENRSFSSLLQGGGMDPEEDRSAWGALATLTFRYPIPCSRFAPYAWAGVGGYFHDSRDNTAYPFFRNDDRDDEGVFIGQFGAGIEFRFTPHVGWTNDVSFNLVEGGGKHDFVQVRTGLNFAF